MNISLLSEKISLFFMTISVLSEKISYFLNEYFTTGTFWENFLIFYDDFSTSWENFLFFKWIFHYFLRKFPYLLKQFWRWSDLELLPEVAEVKATLVDAEQHAARLRGLDRWVIMSILTNKTKKSPFLHKVKYKPSVKSSFVDPDPHGSGTYAWIRIRN